MDDFRKRALFIASFALMLLVIAFLITNAVAPRKERPPGESAAPP